MSLIQDYQTILEEGLFISNRTYNQEQYEYETFIQLDCKKVIFNKLQFQHCDLSNAIFNHVQFIDCDFSNANLQDAYFNNCEFSHTKFMGTLFMQSILKEVKMDSCTFAYANVSQSVCTKCEVRNCDFTETDFSKSKLKQIFTNNCQFIRTQFFHTPLNGLSFVNDTFYDLLLSDTNSELKGLEINSMQAVDLCMRLGVKIK